MQRSPLATAVIGAISGMIGMAAAIAPAHAMRLNQEGTGQVLLYPYYTVNADNVSLITVVNNQPHAKAIKVRFREAYNGQDVFNVNVFLSAFDVWTSTVFALNATGGANILSDDESCTIPDIKNATGPGVLYLPPPDGRSYLPFRSTSYQGDGGPTAIGRTREGHLEILEMATIAVNSDIEAAVTHDKGIPAGCDQLAALIDARPQDLYGSPGGLFGSASIVNPAAGTTISYNADAIEGFYWLVPTLYSSGRNNSPTLADARTTATTVRSITFGVAAADPTEEVIRATYPSTRAIDAVSSLFTADTISNEYTLDTASGLESEWVITFPTKHFYVNHTPAIPPFVQRFAAPGKACVVVAYTYFNREEMMVIDPASCGDFCPPVEPTKICTETQVLTFQEGDDYASNGGVSALLGSKLTVNVDPRTDGHFNSGWLRLDLNPLGMPAQPHALRPSTEGNVFHGLPVTGFLATNHVNQNNGVPNVLSAYSTTSKHRSTRFCDSISSTSGFCSEDN